MELKRGRKVKFRRVGANRRTPIEFLILKLILLNGNCTQVVRLVLALSFHFVLGNL